MSRPLEPDPDDTGVGKWNLNALTLLPSGDRPEDLWHAQNFKPQQALRGSARI